MKYPWIPVFEIGAPDKIRTCDLCLRRATLYPAELRVPEFPLVTHTGSESQVAKRKTPRDYSHGAFFIR